jgi:hypothetical protein
VTWLIEQLKRQLETALQGTAEAVTLTRIGKVAHHHKGLTV